MRFKCNCGSRLLYLSMQKEEYNWRMIEGYFPDPEVSFGEIEWTGEAVGEEHWRGQCEFCNKKWGPFYDLDELKQVLKREGVLK